MMIDPNSWYSNEEILKKNLLPMFKSGYSLKKFIKLGKLRAVQTGRDYGKRYKIKGSWLIMFIAKWESGDFHS